MEIGVRLFGAFQILVSFITYPIFIFNVWWRKGQKFLPPIADPLLNHSATELAEKIRNEEVTAEQVIRAFITRCKIVNPRLNAIVEQRFEEAVKEAYEIDQLIASHNKKPEQIKKETPLLGVPITVKESVAVKGLSLSVGSKVRSNIKAQRDGDSVENLRKAGAIPIAVTNTPELCLCWESNNLVTGCTLNPYDFNRTPGGSSGGEAALISSGASIAGIGSDIAGSIRIPAMYCGIFGHKPSPGYVGLGGHYPWAADENFEKFLTIGPMTRYAKDLSMFLKIMAGKNADCLRLDDKVNLSELNIYYMDQAGESLVIIDTDKEIKKVINDAVNHFKISHGCKVQDAKIKEMIDSVEISAAVFFGMEGVPQVLTMSNNGDPKKKKNLYFELLKSMFGLSEFSFPALMFTVLHEYNCFIPRSKYTEYCKQNEALHDKFKELLGSNGVFIYPTHPIPAYFHNQYLMKSAGVMYTMIFNTLCMPATHVPMGLNDKGLPIGIQVVAAPGQDRLCLAVANELEAVFKGWVPPPSS